MNKVSLKNTVYFICSPSLGLLDNWLSVIWSLKERRQDLKFIIVFPKPNILDQVHLSNVLIILASKIFDSIIFKTEGGSWLVEENFSMAKMRINHSKIEWFLIRSIGKLKKWKITKTLGCLIQFGYGVFSRNLNKRYQYNWQYSKNNRLCILYDVYDESKPFNLELMKIFKEVPKFSIQHGININDGGVLSNTKKVSDGNLRKDVKAYLFSPMEVPIYEYKYSINKSFMEVVGVPRHSPNWMEFIRLNILKYNNEIKSFNNGNGSIFIISRPGGSNYFSLSSKKKALQDIKRLAWKDLKKNIVVKLHPKEKKEGIYEEVFGTNTYGDNWVYSDLHPFILAKESDFAISFYSCVVIDMIALGVPTIEYLDLRGIPEFDNEDSLRDKMGDPVFSYRYLNLVLGASDYEMMKTHVMEIINDRDAVISRLQTTYNKLFPKIININDKIAKDILDLSLKKYV